MKRLTLMQGLQIGLGLGLSSLAHALPADPQKIASELRMTPQTVRVRLSNLGRVMTVRGTDLALSLAKKPGLGNVRADEWVIDCKRSLIYQPETNKSRQIPRSGILIESLSGVLSINEKRFREQIVVYPKELQSPYDSSLRGNSECLVVNHIQIEKYLESVVNGEFNSQWAEPAVEAQIIAARTYALFQMKEMRKDKGRVYDVESTQKDQVYLGMDRADSKATQLVAKTRGMIMMPKGNRNLEPIKAFYHASCGGRTVVPEQVWGARFAGFKKGVPCPYCNPSPSFNWDYRLSFHDIEKRIWNGIQKDSNGRKVWPEQYTSDPNRWYLMDVKPKYGDRAPKQKSSNLALVRDAEAAGEPARITDIVFEFVNRENFDQRLKVTMDAYVARNWFDPAKLKSTWFSMTSLGRSILFRGKGSGHGVGMCQWGAKKMGEIGFTRDQILSHYYPDTKIARIWK